MLEYDRIFWKLLLKGLYLQFLIAISSSLTHCSSVLAYSYSGVLYCTEYQRLCKLTLGICTASNSIKLKCLIGSDCLLFCLSPINSSLVISTLHIRLFSLGEHRKSSSKRTAFLFYLLPPYLSGCGCPAGGGWLLGVCLASSDCASCVKI